MKHLTHRQSIVVAVTLIVFVLGIALFINIHNRLFGEQDEVLPPTPPLTEEVAPQAPWPVVQSIGSSVEGRTLEAYTFGTGDTHLLFIGGIHGGYEWNSVLLAYEFIDHLTANPAIIPEGLTVNVIPSLNPDGVYKVIGKEGRFTPEDALLETNPAAGRFNANGVDLNRNFDCKWQPESTWRGNIVSAGTETFSEPEAAALRDYVVNSNPKAVVFWHSQSDAVYASECENGILPGTRELMNAYAGAAGYKAVDVFDAYPITGDAEGWLASIGIPAVTVELSSHTAIEWERNLKGFEAVLGLHADSANIAR
jgi:hypothetical protein